MLIDDEQDDAEVLQAEDEAILATDEPTERTPLDDLTELLNGPPEKVQPGV